MIQTAGSKISIIKYVIYNFETNRFELTLPSYVVKENEPNAGIGGSSRAGGVGPRSGKSKRADKQVVTAKALLAGGVGPTPQEAATRQAYVYDLATDTWNGLQMAEARNAHTLTSLPDGRALIAGGWNGKGPPNSLALASAEVFDPVTMSFASTGAMTTGRFNHAAALLADGRVLITGGDTFVNFETFATAEIYDPATGQFTATGSMSQMRSFHTATSLADGRVLVVGDNVSKSAEVFDPISGTFTPVGDMTSTHGAGHSATRLDSGQVLIAGGFANPNGARSAVAEVFDPVTNAFSAVSSMTSARQYHAAVLLPDGMVLISGGIAGNGETVATAELFDPTTGQFTKTDTDMPLPASEHAVVLVSVE